MRSLACATLVGSVLMFLTASPPAAADDPRALPPASEALVLDLGSAWHVAPSAVKSSQYVWTAPAPAPAPGSDPGREADDDGVRFVVGAANGGGAWSLTGFAVDPRRYPILSITYRAEGLDAGVEDGIVTWLSDLGVEGFSVGTRQDLVDDGEPHKLTYDLRQLLPPRWSGTRINHLILPVVSGPDGPGTFDLLDLRFAAADDADTAEALPAVEPFEVIVHDADGEPVAGATVISDPMWGNAAARFTTNDQGVARVTPSAAGGGTQLRIEADGFATGLLQQRVAALPSVRELVREPVVLPRGRTYGGTVADEAGEPVAEAVVVLVTGQNRSCATPGLYRNVVPMRVLTDAQGRWSSPVLPDTEHFALFAAAVKPGVVPPARDSAGEEIDLDAARAGDAVVTLAGGRALAGVVTDAQGNPVAGAEVRLGGRHHFPGAPINTPVATTDASGRYRFAAVPEGEVLLTVTAAGHAPELVHREQLDDASPDLDITLPQPQRFAVKVVDDDGQPIPNLLLSDPQWRGLHTLRAQLRTDANGVAEWLGPNDAVTFLATLGERSNTQRVQLQPVGPDGPPQVVTLHRPMTLAATVRDGETGAPIAGARLVYADVYNAQREPHFLWQTTLAAVADADGMAELTGRVTRTGPIPALVWRGE